MFQRSFPSFSVFLACGFENLGQEVELDCHKISTLISFKDLFICLRII